MMTTLAAFLAPCLPFLWEKVGAPVLDSATDNVGDAVWEKAQAIWAKLFPKIEQDDATKVVAAELAKNPQSDVWKAAFQEKLQALLEQDQQLKRAIADILDEKTDAPTGMRVQIAVDKNKGQVIGHMTHSEAKHIGHVDTLQGDVNF